MAEETIQARFTCPLCGGHELNVEDPSDDSSAVSCASCSTEFGAWGPIRLKLIAEARAAGEVGNKVAFKGLSGSWKF